MTRREALRGAAVLMLLPLLGAQRRPAGRLHRIEMRAMRFGAIPTGLRAGDTILWVNSDPVPHTATARDGSFDLVLAPRASGRTRLARAGTVEVYCRYHPAMRARLSAT